MSLGCAKCNYQNADDAKFCQRCGAGLGQPEKKCPSCGKTNELGAGFCKSCGKKLGAAPLTPEQWHESFKNKFWFYRNTWAKNGDGWQLYQAAFSLYHRKTGIYLNHEKYSLLIPIISKDFYIQCCSYQGKNAFYGLLLALETKWVFADLTNDRIIQVPVKNLSRYAYKDWCMSLTLKDDSIITLQVKKAGNGYANLLEATNVISSFSSKTSMTDVIVGGREVERAREKVAESNNLGVAFWIEVCNYIKEAWAQMGML